MGHHLPELAYFCPLMFQSPDILSIARKAPVMYNELELLYQKDQQIPGSVHYTIHRYRKNIAFEIDELLWQFEPSAFVPHNLKGEGATTGSPVEIGFDRLGPNKSRQLLINLADQVPPFAVNFGQIFDFVANDDQHKAIARERYRQYRGLGIELTTQNLATHPLNLA